MAEWLVCPACQLKHSARPDGTCPRCGAYARGGGVAVPQAYAAPLGSRYGAPAAPSTALLEIAAKRRSMVLAFFATLAAWVGGFALLVVVFALTDRIPGGLIGLWALSIAGLSLWQVVGVFRVAEAIGSSPIGWLLGMWFLPLFGWALPLVLAGKANEVLRNRGLKVGFWGPLA